MKKRIISLLLAVLMILPLVPIEAHAHSVVMTAEKFIDYLQYVVDRGDSKYGSGDQYSIGKYYGNNIYFDCWGLGESIICTNGQIVYNRDTTVNPWNMWDTSCGCGSYNGDWIENQCQLSSDFTNMVPGEWLFRENSNGTCYHVGYYVGGGKVIESTSDGSYNTQVSTIDSSGHSNLRGSSWTWTFHGKVPWIDYTGTAGTSNYLSQCPSEPSYCSLEITKKTTIKTLPCSKDTCADSGDIATLSSGTLTATGIYKNTANNYWYKVSYDGKTGYVYSGDTKVVKFLTDKLEINDVSAPTSLKQGSSFSIAGTISTKYNIISNVAAYVYPGSATSGTASTGTNVNVNTYSYSLKNSAVDSGVVFGSLSAGSYTYCISATVKSYYCTDGKNLQSNTTKKTLHTSGFAVTGGTVSDTLSISNYNYPTSIKQGNVYSIYGTITSSYSNISSVTVGVYDSSGNMKTGKTAYPNTKTYSIANLDNYVYFNNLTAGTYYYRVTASNASGSKQLLNKQFTVTGGTSSVTVLRTVYCKHKVTLPARVINLYLNPTDTSRKTYFDYGPTVTSYYYAVMSDGSTMYHIVANHQGVDTELWFKYESDMVVDIKHTFGSYKYDYAHPHAEYHTCECGYTEYTGDDSYRDGCEECIPRIELSTYNVNLDRRDNPSQTIVVTALGNLPSRYNVRSERSTDSISCSWGSWEGNTVSLTVTARERGSGYVTILLLDKTDGEEIIYSVSLHVGITSPSYTVRYDANGGAYAPSPQTKYYNETLYISEEQPYRENYEFIGWSTSNSSSGYEYLPGSSYTSNSSVTLYAVWKEHVHSYTQWPVAATCTEEGYTVYSCNCGYVYAGNSVPALGHSWNSGIVTKEPTEDAAGEKMFSCTRCTETKTESIPALGHTHSYNSTTVAPTCTEQGYIVYTCNCGDSFTGNYTAALGHSYSNGVCVRCGAKAPAIGFENPFIDVKENDYFYDPVLWAVQQGITNGTSPTEFSPEDPCTRGQIVTFLWRSFGSPEPTKTDNPFVDVSSNMYYYKAVLWAVEQGITTGVSKTEFEPDATCTRGQVATFLWRACGKPAPESNSNPFSDVAGNMYYYQPILWAVEEGITNGTGGGKFSPEESCTRGQIVTFLYRALAE